MENELPMYTVVIPAGPRCPYILEALASVYDQTHPPVRVLMVLNALPEVEPDYVGQVRQRYEEVEILQSSRPGMLWGMNVGIAAVETPVVAFLDSDDLWSADKQQLQIAALAADPALDAVYGIASNFRTNEAGQRVTIRTGPTKTFTNTSFPIATFDKFGALDSEASHFSWLFRWWAQAHDQGIRTQQIPSITLLRRVHEENSWVLENSHAQHTLLREVRGILHRRDRRR